MSKAITFIDARRIEVVLTSGEGDESDKPSSLFDLWLVLQSPGGMPRETIRVQGGPFDRTGAVEKFEEIWKAVGKQFGEPTALSLKSQAPSLAP